MDHIKINIQDAHLLLTTGENDRQKIREKIQSKKFSRVIAVGGDGTIALVAQELIDKEISLGILPAGSANGLAAELSIPMQMSDALEKAINGKANPFDLIKINDKWHVLHMADFGLNASLVKRYQSDDHRGLFGYAISGLKEIPNLISTNSFELKMKELTHTLDSSFVIIANARRYGTGIEVNPDGKTGDGKFEICCLQSLSFENYLKQFIEKKEFELNPFKIFSTDQAYIRLREKADFQIDGEYIGELDEFKIEILKGAVKVIY
ncbi:MAG: diacylglycerol/lipid kinase family protein [Bacteroidota bacterium]